MKTTTKASARETTLASKVVKTVNFSNRDLYVAEAIIRIARRLLRRMRAVLASQRMYECGVEIQ
jgi:hypothetical protein